MATEIKMPQLGESVVEGTITKWLKQEGESVEEDELLVEISTDKVDSEVPSSASGTIEKILVQEGDTVEIGKAIALIGAGDGESGGSEEAQPGDEEESGEQTAEAEAGSGEAEEAEADSDDEQEDSGSEQEAEASSEEGEESGEQTAEAEAESDEEEGDQEEPRQEDSGSEDAEEASSSGRQESGDDGEGAEEPAPTKAEASGDTSKRGVISPLVRRLAGEHGVDLDDIEGTGTGGRIRKQDVLKFVEEGGKSERRPAAEEEEKPAAQAEAPSSRQAGEREELVPWTNIRKRTAEHMIASHLETARAWNAIDADWTGIVKARTAAKDGFKESEGFNLTFLPFLAKVLCETLLEMPEVNATYDEDQGGNVLKHYVNLGIAVALEGGGLIVPVVKEADEKNLVGLARGINEVVTKTRTKKLSPDDLSGGTFSITNPGPFGSIISVPIIPRGQTAILGFEAIEKRVVVTDDDSFGIRSMGFLSLSWDHRAIDGAEAARFLARLKERIETTDFSGDLAKYA